MKFNVSATLEYDVQEPGTIILNIHALRTPGQTVLSENFSVSPEMKCEELLSAFNENRFLRIVVPEKNYLTINYSATVETFFQYTNHEYQNDLSVAELGSSVFPYLYPSRYCQSDKLYRFANNKFGKIDNPYLKVRALTDWIHRNIEYLSGSTNSQTSAYDTVTEQAGVCRDFAHLGIALCRALTIPARYFTGYAFKLNPPDFHACFEAYIGGYWILFDATRLAPLNGLVKIATGRDAADTAIANMFGNMVFTNMKVTAENIDESFEPFYYKENDTTGIAY